MSFGGGGGGDDVDDGAVDVDEGFDDEDDGLDVEVAVDAGEAVVEAVVAPFTLSTANVVGGGLDAGLAGLLFAAIADGDEPEAGGDKFVEPVGDDERDGAQVSNVQAEVGKRI